MTDKTKVRYHRPQGGTVEAHLHSVKPDGTFIVSTTSGLHHACHRDRIEFVNGNPFEDGIPGMDNVDPATNVNRDFTPSMGAVYARKDGREWIMVDRFGRLITGSWESKKALMNEIGANGSHSYKDDLRQDRVYQLHLPFIGEKNQSEDT